MIFIFYRKSYEDKYEHLINDKEVETSQGKYVLGNITAQTSVKAFINNLRNESNKIKLYDNNNTLVYDGIASGGVVADNLNNKFVATGYKVEYYYNNNLYDTMYLSILVYMLSVVLSTQVVFHASLKVIFA